MTDFPSASYDDWKLSNREEEYERMYGPWNEDEPEDPIAQLERELAEEQSAHRVTCAVLAHQIIRADKAEAELAALKAEIAGGAHDSANYPANSENNQINGKEATP